MFMKVTFYPLWSNHWVLYNERWHCVRCPWKGATVSVFICLCPHMENISVVILNFCSPASSGVFGSWLLCNCSFLLFTCLQCFVSRMAKLNCPLCCPASLPPSPPVPPSNIVTYFQSFLLFLWQSFTVTLLFMSELQSFWSILPERTTVVKWVAW